MKCEGVLSNSFEIHRNERSQVRKQNVWQQLWNTKPFTFTLGFESNPAHLQPELLTCQYHVVAWNSSSSWSALSGIEHRTLDSMHGLEDNPTWFLLWGQCTSCIETAQAVSWLSSSKASPPKNRVKQHCPIMLVALLVGNSEELVDSKETAPSFRLEARVQHMGG